MAEWVRDGAGYPVELHPGHPGWTSGALAWLADHPGRRVPFGDFGDVTDVYRAAVEEIKGWYPAGSDEK